MYYVHDYTPKQSYFNPNTHTNIYIYTNLNTQASIQTYTFPNIHTHIQTHTNKHAHKLAPWSGACQEEKEMYHYILKLRNYLKILEIKFNKIF